MNHAIAPIKNSFAFSLINNSCVKFVNNMFVMLASKCPQNYDKLFPSGFSIFLGMKISKKILKTGAKSVFRNAIKRRIRSFCISYMQENALNFPLAIIVIPRSSINLCKYQEAKLEFFRSCDFLIRKLTKNQI